MEIRNTNETELALKKLGITETTEYQFDLDTIVALHDLGIEKYGGSFGIRDQNLLESVAKTPYQSVFGQDLYPTVIDKAAKYLYDFANYQVFVDGNKRTGLQVCTSLLDMNYLSLDMTAEQQYFLVMDIANHKIENSEQVAEILQQHIKFQEQTQEQTINQDLPVLNIELE